MIFIKSNIYCILNCRRIPGKFYIFLGASIAKRLDDELEKHNRDLENNGKAIIHIKTFMPDDFSCQECC